MTDCNKAQANNLGCNKISLTEQWQKGELTRGWYWVEGCRAEGIYAYTAEYLNNMYRPRNSERIIEQVPSYEEWQAKLEENTKLKTDCKTLAQKLLQVKPELRDWLKVNYKEYL